MPKYQLTDRCFLQANGTADAWLYEAGSQVEYDGIPHRHWVPLDDAARAAIAAIPPLTSFAKNIAKRRGDPPSSA